MIKYDINNVTNNESGILFKEVMQHFYNDNYRACMVQLYTLVIFDIVQKINSYLDTNESGDLKKIKIEIESKISTQAHYSEIEKGIIEALRSKKKIGKIMYDKVKILREERNNSAHFGLYEKSLYMPTSYCTLDLIDYFYNNLFSKSDQIFSNLKDLILEKMEIKSLFN